MNQQHEQSHASASATAATRNDTFEPGQSNRSALLRKRDHAVASGLVQRNPRDPNGVAGGADHAVAAAASSSGSTLPGTLMRKFESSLGAGLSSVRVHTGGRSERAANAVGAKAYTMGNDIHFGAGHYDPSSPGGQHLLAHEVAHTVQQSGGTKRMQRKLAISSPGDGLEHEADRAADAMVSGGAATVSGASGLSRQPAAAPFEASPSAKQAPAASMTQPQAGKAVEDHAAEALLISYPDYRVDTGIRRKKTDKTGVRLALGHAGVLLIRGDGLTRYYEYGRYDREDRIDDGTSGRVRQVTVPRVKIGPDGKATPASLEAVLARLSHDAGRDARGAPDGRIDAAYFQNVNYAVMEAYAQEKFKESDLKHKDYKKDRRPYDPIDNSCSTFAEDVITQDGNIDRPFILNPLPHNSATEYQEEGNAKVSYDPSAKKGKRLTIGAWDEDDAKRDDDPVDAAAVRTAVAKGKHAGTSTKSMQDWIRILMAAGGDKDQATIIRILSASTTNVKAVVDGVGYGKIWDKVYGDRCMELTKLLKSKGYFVAMKPNDKLDLVKKMSRWGTNANAQEVIVSILEGASKSDVKTIIDTVGNFQLNFDLTGKHQKRYDEVKRKHGL